MQIKLNDIGFTVSEVSGPVRAAVLTDKDVMPGVIRGVWEWDAEAGEAKALPGLRAELAVPTGLAFFVARPGEGPKLMRNDGATEKMRERFLAAVKAKAQGDLVAALNRTIGPGQVKMPYAEFEKLKAVCSFRLVAHTDFAVAELKEASRNLSAFLLVAGQVAFKAEILKVTDEAGKAALEAEDPQLFTRIPAAILPAKTRAALDIRRMALVRRVGEVQVLIRHLEAEGRSENDLRMPKVELARLATEARLLAPKADSANANVAPQAG